MARVKSPSAKPLPRKGGRSPATAGSGDRRADIQDSDAESDSDGDDALDAELVVNGESGSDNEGFGGRGHGNRSGNGNGNGPDEDVLDGELDFDAVRAEVVDAPEAEPGQGLRVDRSAPLARYDPLQAYMRDVQRYKLLTPKEEHDVAVQYFETGDVDSAARLVTANLRLRLPARAQEHQ
jgi:RNA polymerase sigma-32 factor